MDLPVSTQSSATSSGFAWNGKDNATARSAFSGETGLFRGVREVARRFTIGAALLHLGKVQFPVTGPLRYTLTAQDAVEVFRLLRPHVLIPIHYEGWSHFHEGREAIERQFARAPDDMQRRVRWLTPGVGVVIEV